MSDSSSDISDTGRKSGSSAPSDAGPSNDFQKDIRSKYESNANKNCEYVELQKLNPNISKMDEDILYHIALGNKSHDLQKMFKDIQVDGPILRFLNKFCNNFYKNLKN